MSGVPSWKYLTIIQLGVVGRHRAIDCKHNDIGLPGPFRVGSFGGVPYRTCRRRLMVGVQK